MATAIKVPEVIGVTASGEEVFSSPHFNLSKTLKRLLKAKILPQIDVPEKVWSRFVTDVGEPVGKDRHVEVNSNDIVIYAKRRKQTGLSPFVLNKQAKETTFVSITLQRLDKRILLNAAHFGEVNAPQEPWNLLPSEDSLQYWNKHAFVWGVARSVPGTETPFCPWHSENLSLQLQVVRLIETTPCSCMEKDRLIQELQQCLMSGADYLQLRVIHQDAQQHFSLEVQKLAKSIQE